MTGPDPAIAAGGGATAVSLDGRPVARKVFVHINNTNPVLLGDSPERAEAEAGGWEIAYDGMEITL